MISNWSNNFAKFDYLPHAWDAKVANYKDGVGYNDSLKVSTVKDLDTELGTSVSIYGYKKSEKKIEEYLSVFGAVSIEGPKWCGKTWTSKYHSNSEFLLSDPKGNSLLFMAMV